MRDTKARDRMMQDPRTMKPWMTLRRGLRFAVVAAGIGLVMTTGAARAGDDEDDDKTFEEKIIDNIMAGIGATNMENRGIDYRERSPLVVPRKLDLPPPAPASANVNVPNWPKDPDEARRKEAIAERKKARGKEVTRRPLTPAEMEVGRIAAPTRSTANDPAQPGTSQNNPILSPSQLGFSGSLGDLLGGNKTETAQFKGEPERQTLTQPPPGYQTPSPNFAYGTGPKESLNKEYNPAAGKYGD